MELSIIVPIYNVEKYLRECLDSLYSISNIKLEIILINDGSRDSSLSIAKEYEKRYREKTLLISKENGGLSSGRNLGLDMAKGDYVAFIDSDDFIDVEKFQKFFKIVQENNLDIGVGNFKYYYEDGETGDIFRSSSVKRGEVLSGSEFLELILQKPKCFREEVVDDLYRRRFLIENNLKFKEGILHEDSYFTPRAYLRAERVKFIDIAYYYYRQRSGSIMSEVNEKSIESLDYITRNLYRLYNDTDSHGKKALQILLPSFYRVVLYRYLALGKDYREELTFYRTMFLGLKAYENGVLEDKILFLSPRLGALLRKILKRDIGLERKLQKIS